jgi:hypothetical protein
VLQRDMPCWILTNSAFPRPSPTGDPLSAAQT